MSAGPLNVLELFAGIGGLSLGLQRAGMRIVGHVEINPFCRAVLHKHWPEVPCHDDARTAAAWWHSTDRPRVDVIAGGYPCQPESLAGKRRGTNDPRWLWPHMADLIDQLRPTYVIGENVLGHRTRGLPTVLHDLGRLRYTARAGIVDACAVGAPHPRRRLFVLAHAPGKHGPSWLAEINGQQSPLRPRGDGEHASSRRRWRVAPDTGTDRAAHGLSTRLDVDRLHALGNAVVPHVAEHIGRIILDHHESR